MVSTSFGYNILVVYLERVGLGFQVPLCTEVTSRCRVALILHHLRAGQ